MQVLTIQKRSRFEPGPQVHYLQLCPCKYSSLRKINSLKSLLINNAIQQKIPGHDNVGTIVANSVCLIIRLTFSPQKYNANLNNIRI